MTIKTFNILCDKVLLNLKYKSEYKKLCKDLSDYDNHKNIIKKEALRIKKELKLDFNVAGSDKMFYKDYYFGDLQLRFMTSYGYGMIGSSYRVFKGMKDNSIPSFSYRKISESNKRHEEDYIMTYPIITNIEQYKTVLKLVLKINEDFIRLFAKEMSSIKN